MQFFWPGKRRVQGRQLLRKHELIAFSADE